VDEALRNLVAVGADPSRAALLDNFAWGSPAREEELGGLVRAARACHDAALGYGAPFVSGKDSLWNEYRTASGEARAIPGTLLVTALAPLEDAARAATADLKREGDPVYLVGETREELGGSIYNRRLWHVGNAVPKVDFARARARFERLHAAIAAGLVRACHDLSEGGLAVAAAEMAIAGRLGLALDLRAVPGAAAVGSDAALLFSESASRFLVEVAPEDAAAFERAMAGGACARVGAVERDPVLRATGRRGNEALAESVAVLARCFKDPLPLAFGGS